MKDDLLHHLNGGGENGLGDPFLVVPEVVLWVDPGALKDPSFPPKIVGDASHLHRVLRGDGVLVEQVPNAAARTGEDRGEPLDPAYATSTLDSGADTRTRLGIDRRVDEAADRGSKAGAVVRVHPIEKVEDLEVPLSCGNDGGGGVVGGARFREGSSSIPKGVARFVLSMTNAFGDEANGVPQRS